MGSLGVVLKFGYWNVLGPFQVPETWFGPWFIPVPRREIWNFKWCSVNIPIMI